MQQQQHEGEEEQKGEYQGSPFDSLITERSSYEWVHSRNLDNSFTLVGKNTYLIGSESGRFEGRWNGIWSLPIKVADRVHFSIRSPLKTYPLSQYVTRFATKLSHVERSYWIEELRLSIWELMFIPENSQSVCWRFVVKSDGATSGDNEKDVRLVANCLFNLMWEVKQAGELYKVRKEILLYDDNNYSAVARHYRHADWVAIFGANRPPVKKELGLDDSSHSSSSSSTVSTEQTTALPRPDRPCYGNVVLEYSIAKDTERDVWEGFDIDFALTGGSLSSLEAIKEYNRMLINLQLLLLEKSFVYEEYLGNTADILHPEPSLGRAFTWSKVNLHMLDHYQPGFGTGFFAGLPHFAIYFGRDISWAAFGALAIGDFNGARESLSLLARFQAPANGEDMLREPYYRGEIPHEIRTEGTVYYYSTDATSLFVIACRNFLDWTKDLNFVRFLYDNIVRAIEWGIDADRDGDGLIEHGPEGFLIDTTWMDSYYRGKSALDVQAIMCRALLDGAHLARAIGDDSRAKEWAGRADRLRNLIMEKYWDERTGFFYDTIDSSGEPVRAITINSIIPVLFKLVDGGVSSAVLNRIESPDFMTDWGVRTRSKEDPEYDPRSYQKGGVWPFCTGWVTKAEFEFGRYSQGLASIRRFVSGLDMGANYFKEVLYGDLSPTGTQPVQPTGCFIQAWSASMFLSSAIEGLLGVSPTESQSTAIRIMPFLQPGWKEVQVNNIHVADNRFAYKVNLEHDGLRLKIVNDGPAEAQLQTGFVMPIQATSAHSLDGLTGFHQVKEHGNLLVSLDSKIREAESKTLNFRFD